MPTGEELDGGNFVDKSGGGGWIEWKNNAIIIIMIMIIMRNKILELGTSDNSCDNLTLF